jgi:hypothetical protein
MVRDLERIQYLRDGVILLFDDDFHANKCCAGNGVPHFANHDRAETIQCELSCPHAPQPRFTFTGDFDYASQSCHIKATTRHMVDALMALEVAGSKYCPRLQCPAQRAQRARVNKPSNEPRSDTLVIVLSSYIFESPRKIPQPATDQLPNPFAVRNSLFMGFGQITRPVVGLRSATRQIDSRPRTCQNPC